MHTHHTGQLIHYSSHNKAVSNEIAIELINR